MGEQLLEREARAAPDGVPPRARSSSCLARRPVHVARAPPSATAAAAARAPAAESSRARPRFELVQRLRDERAQPSLRHALRSRVDRRQSLLQRRVAGAHAAILRMDHLQAQGPAAHFAEAAQSRAALEPLLLRVRRNRRSAASGTRSRRRGAPAAAAACDRRPRASWTSPSTTARIPGSERADRRNRVRSSYRSGSTKSRSWTCVTPRRASRSASAAPPRRAPSPGAARCARRPALRRGSAKVAACTPISTRAPRGSCATPTVARAG